MVKNGIKEGEGYQERGVSREKGIKMSEKYATKKTN